MAKLNKIKKWMAKGTVVVGDRISGGTKKGKIARIDERDDTVLLEEGGWLRFKGLKKFREESPVPEIKAGDYVRILSTDFEGNGCVPRHVKVGDVGHVLEVRPSAGLPVKVEAPESAVGKWAFPFSAVEKCDGPAKPEPRFKTGDRARLISKAHGALYGFDIGDIGDIVTVDSISSGYSSSLRVTKNGPMPGGPGYCPESALEKIDEEAPPATTGVRLDGDTPRQDRIAAVGSRVRCLDNDADHGRTGVLARVDGSSMGYDVKFDDGGGHWVRSVEVMDAPFAPTKPRPTVGDLVRYVSDDTGYKFEGLGIVIEEDHSSAPFRVQAIYSDRGRETAWHREERVEKVERIVR